MKLLTLFFLCVLITSASHGYLSDQLSSPYPQEVWPIPHTFSGFSCCTLPVDTATYNYSPELCVPYSRFDKWQHWSLTLVPFQLPLLNFSCSHRPSWSISFQDLQSVAALHSSKVLLLGEVPVLSLWAFSPGWAGSAACHPGMIYP